MEAWQKQLNEVLRMGNGFANAGAVPKKVKRKGKHAVEEYKSKRAADKPSSAQWVYEQSLLKQHAHMRDTVVARDLLQKEKKKVSWDDYSKYWCRYMVCAAMRCRLLARVRMGKQRAPTTARERLAVAAAEKPKGYYKQMLTDYHAYYAPVELTADDLEEDEKRRQERSARRKRWREQSCTL